MKLLLAVALAFLPTLTFAQHGPEEGPRFTDWPIINIYKGRHAEPILDAPEKRNFRTWIRGAAKKKPDFAGEWTVAEWGCGTSCGHGAIVNVRTGEVVMLPFKYEGSSMREVTLAEGEEPEFDRFDHNVKSRLFVLHGMHGEDAEKEAHHYFVFDPSTKEFTKVASLPAGGKLAPVIGRWTQIIEGETTPECSKWPDPDKDNDGIITILRKGYKGWEGGCGFNQVRQTGPNTWIIEAQCQYEDLKKRERIKLTLAGNRLTYEDQLAKGEEARPINYNRCTAD